jgi:hypothetical protein
MNTTPMDHQEYKDTPEDLMDSRPTSLDHDKDPTDNGEIFIDLIRLKCPHLKAIFDDSDNPLTNTLIKLILTDYTAMTSSAKLVFRASGVQKGCIDKMEMSHFAKLLLLYCAKINNKELYNYILDSAYEYYTLQVDSSDFLSEDSSSHGALYRYKYTLSNKYMSVTYAARHTIKRSFVGGVSVIVTPKGSKATPELVGLRKVSRRKTISIEDIRQIFNFDIEDLSNTLKVEAFKLASELPKNKDAALDVIMADADGILKWLKTK